MKQKVFSIICVLLLAGCRQDTDRPVISKSADITQPVIQYWDGGVHMIGKPPFVLFAAWSDGMVVKQVGEKTMVGFISPQKAAGLALAVRDAGFFKPSASHLLDTYGMVFPDGPVRCLSVVDGGKQRTLYYHGRDDLNHLEQIGPNAGPSRVQCETFIAMWKRVVAEIERVAPDKLEPFTLNRNLTYPQFIEKSQPNTAGYSPPAARSAQPTP